MRDNGMLMADLNALTIFAKVVEASSFSKAALRLNMPISTVSRRITELEDQLGVRLIERSTRSLRLTDIGAQILEHAQRSVELGEIVDDLKINRATELTGVVRLSAPPNIADSLLAPIVSAFQAAYPKVRVQITVAARVVDHIADGADLVFRVGPVNDPALAAQKILAYRHQLVASPGYLAAHEPLKSPQDLARHKIIAFSPVQSDVLWTFSHVNGTDKETVRIRPYLSMNDFTGLTAVLAGGSGIGDLPPIVMPKLIREGRLVEVMPDWRFQTWDLSMAYLDKRRLTRPVRVFREFACEMAPALFPALPA
jgi:DNA-binding transcriptional LysR family regulator